MNILVELRTRGVLKQVSNEEKFLSLPKGTAIYAGFDPTATSLHLGNYIQITTLLRFKEFGYKVYALVGGATGMIGDPSFKSAERQLLDDSVVVQNKNNIKKQLEKYGLEVVDNYDFYKNMNILEFLRDAGKLVNVSYMLTKDSISNRIDKGLSFTEFSYTLIQGWDFLHLYNTKDVFVQLGGSDQWGNLTTGLDMISKVHGDQHKAVVLTSNLLTDENDVKFGKSTGGGSLWLDPELTKPYNMYQFLINQPDSQIEKLLRWLTFLTIPQVLKIMAVHNQNPSLRYAQKKLAYQVISQVHSIEAAEKAQTLSNILFNKDFNFDDLNETQVASIYGEIESIELKKNSNLIESLIELGILKSKREAREFIETNSIKVNGIPVQETQVVESELYEGKYLFLNIGKKKLFLAKLKR
ncbi:tyrosine--tRNA ligase [Mycoplasma corogypsi]|uniref:tyrosine--tRNA ligase n=1 Tax=Mycoplasma corogypsi TaxID=2106 RepID=UPI0038731A8C